MIYVEPCGGLCNRIYALVDAYEIAKKKEDSVYIIWKNDFQVPCDYENLFEDFYAQNKINAIIKNVYGVKQGYRILLKKRKFSEFVGEVVNRTAMKYLVKKCRSKCELIIEDYPKNEYEINYKDYESIYIRTCLDFTNGDVKCVLFNKHLERKSKEIFCKMMNNDNNPQYILFGVHIRRTDHIKSKESSPTRLFEEKINSVICNEDVAERALFFVCSDDCYEEKHLLEKFGEERILTRNKSFLRASIQGQQDAVIDLLCLSQCKKIFGSKDSTFSEVAAKYGNIELEVLENTDGGLDGAVAMEY